MFKLALNAGHYKYTAGKRCHWDIDPAQTREWVLNDRICDKIEKILADYDGIEILRIDDTTGETDISLKNRTNKANKWGADFWLGIHHNAAGRKFSGGGIVAFIYTKASAKSAEWQKALYNASIKATGLKGNRSTPLAKKNLHEVRETKMPAVLMECGFMDSTVDCPIILTEDFANKIAKAFADVIIEKSGATKKKPVQPEIKPNPEPEKPKAEYKPSVNEIVEYIGTVHYSNSNSTTPKACKPGLAKVTRTYNGKHPYHLINTTGSKEGVYGWVDAEFILKYEVPKEENEPIVEIVPEPTPIISEPKPIPEIKEDHTPIINPGPTITPPKPEPQPEPKKKWYIQLFEFILNLIKKVMKK